MSIQRNITQDPLYLDFKSISDDDYRSKVRFFEMNSKELSGIDYHLWIDTKMSYIFALFEMGAYSKLLLLIDALIEEVVIENVGIHQAEDPFEALVYRKAACLFNVGNYEESCVLLKQLTKINPKENLYKQLFRKAKLSQPKPKYLRLRAVSLLMIILIVPVLIAELIVVKTLFPDYSSLFMWIRTILIFGGIGLFLVLEYNKLRNIEKELSAI